MCIRDSYRTTTIPGPAAQGYPALLTAVLSKLHHSKSNYEYTVSGICNPYLQVKVCDPYVTCTSPSLESQDAGACVLLGLPAGPLTEPGPRQTVFVETSQMQTMLQPAPA